MLVTAEEKEMLQKLAKTVNFLDSIALLRSPLELALWSGKPGDMEMISFDEGLTHFTEMEGKCESVIIPGTDFILIYDADNKIVLEGDAYILTNFLVMKSYYGLKPITEDEVEHMLAYFRVNLVPFVCGPDRFMAYKL